MRWVSQSPHAGYWRTFSTQILKKICTLLMLDMPPFQIQSNLRVICTFDPKLLGFLVMHITSNITSGSGGSLCHCALAPPRLTPEVWTLWETSNYKCGTWWIQKIWAVRERIRSLKGYFDALFTLQKPKGCFNPGILVAALLPNNVHINRSFEGLSGKRRQAF